MKENEKENEENSWDNIYLPSKSVVKETEKAVRFKIPVENSEELAGYMFYAPKMLVHKTKSLSNDTISIGFNSDTKYTLEKYGFDKKTKKFNLEDKKEMSGEELKNIINNRDRKKEIVLKDDDIKKIEEKMVTLRSILEDNNIIVRKQ